MNGDTQHSGDVATSRRVVANRGREDHKKQEIVDAVGLLQAAASSSDSPERTQTETLLLYLSVREELVLRLRYGIGATKLPTQAAIGAVLGVSGPRISMIEAGAMRIVRFRLASGHHLRPHGEALESF